MKSMRMIDKKVAYWFIQFYNYPILNEIMKFISSCGDFGMSWLIIILITNLIPSTQKMSVDMLFALILATLAGQITIKTLVKRKRPCHRYHDVNMLVTIPSDYSFPSGHTTASFACSTVMFLYCPLLGIIGYVYALLTGISRLYLFVHYLSDVIFGMILGITVGWIAMFL